MRHQHGLLTHPQPLLAGLTRLATLRSGVTQRAPLRHRAVTSQRTESHGALQNGRLLRAPPKRHAIRAPDRGTVARGWAVRARQSPTHHRRDACLTPTSTPARLSSITRASLCD